MLATIIISIILAAIAALIIRNIIKTRRSGGCISGCSGCSMSGICHDKNTVGKS